MINDEFAPEIVGTPGGFPAMDIPLSPPAPQGTCPVGRPGNLQYYETSEDDIQDSIPIFPSTAPPSRSRAVLPVASRNPLPAAPPLRGSLGRHPSPPHDGFPLDRERNAIFLSSPGRA